ncbi:hypothetical protein FHR76_002219 [Rhizobium sp. RAS22]|nr:hypothetical protein [Rhizobium sp. RAS22]
MADLSDNRWNEQANLNTSPTPDGLPNGTNPSALYGLMREERAAYKRSWKRMNTIVMSTGAANAYVLAYDVAPTDNVNGEWFSFFAHADNTGAATIKINNLTAKNLLDSNGVALVAGAIKAGCSYTVEYKDTAYRLRGLSINNPVFKGTASFENGAFTGRLSQDGQRVLTVADFGTGKGLDADKLDGQEGTFYLERANGTGTQPISTVSGLQAAIDAKANKSGDTITGTLQVGTAANAVKLYTDGSISAGSSLTLQSVGSNAANLELRAQANAAALIDFSPNAYGGDYNWRVVAHPDNVSFDILHNGVHRFRFRNDGFLWTSAFGWINERFSDRGAQVQHNSGIWEFGSVDPNYNERTTDAPNPWVLVGLRSARGTNVINMRAVWLRNN